MSILVISGSPSLTPSRSSALLDYVAARLVLADVEVGRVALRDLPAEDLIEVRSSGAAARRLRSAVERSDAVVIATPIYNASVPGGLKALLDLLPERALLGKPVLPLASGGSAGHQLAIEYSLKPILSALGARHVLAGVFACEGDVAWSEEADALPTFRHELKVRLDEAVGALLSLVAIERPGSPRGRGDLATPELATPFAERCSA